MIKRIYEPDLASTCFFRTAVTLPNYKVLLQMIDLIILDLLMLLDYFILMTMNIAGWDALTMAIVMIIVSLLKI